MQSWHKWSLPKWDITNLDQPLTADTRIHLKKRRKQRLVGNGQILASKFQLRIAKFQLRIAKPQAWTKKQYNIWTWCSISLTDPCPCTAKSPKVSESYAFLTRTILHGTDVAVQTHPRPQDARMLARHQWDDGWNIHSKVYGSQLSPSCSTGIPYLQAMEFGHL